MGFSSIEYVDHPNPTKKEAYYAFEWVFSFTGGL